MTVKLRLFDGRELELRGDVPATRADCPAERPCGHVRCRYHLWRVDGHDRQGRIPKAASAQSSTLRAAWLDGSTPPSCALDEADRVEPGAEMRFADLGIALGHDDERMSHTLVDRAVAALTAAARDVLEPGEEIGIARLVARNAK